MPFRYPIALELSRRRCVVVGGGPEAEGKARALLEADAEVVVIAAQHSFGLVDLARRGELDLIWRPYRHGDLAGVFLVVDAGGDRTQSAAVFAEAEARRVLCNAVDDTAHCHFAVPAVVRRGELLVTVSSGGRSPALAKRLRRRLTEQIGWEYEVLVDLLGEVRAEALPGRTVSFAVWAQRWEAILEEEDELVRLVAAGREDEVRVRARAHLEGRVGAPAG